jgi:hypothetical protein
MSSRPQFKHVSGSSGQIESICMKCLLAVGIESSEDAIAAKEGGHECPREDEKSLCAETKSSTN